MVTFPHGETNVTLACQNKCVSCNHFIPIQDPWFIDPTDFARDLSMAAQVMHFQVFNLVGGEPTLHPRLMDLIRIVRESGISDSIEITTNGQAYRRWPDEMYQEIDELIVTPYKLNKSELDLIADKCFLFGTRFQTHPVIFTWAAYRDPHSPERAAALYKSCWYAANRNVIDEGYFHRCCIGRFIPSLLQGRDKNADALPLEGLTEDRLLAFMRQAETPEMCNVCASNCGAQITWREIGRENWREVSLG
jgi:hypothetical protein